MEWGVIVSNIGPSQDNTVKQDPQGQNSINRVNRSMRLKWSGL